MNISGVQIIGGVLAILSGVLLVVFFAKLDELVSRQYYALFQVEPTPETLDRYRLDRNGIISD